MCGICGIYGSDIKARLSESIFRQMTDSLSHRGPDDRGIERFDTCYLGFRRLAIIDLQTGRQPMASEDKTVWIICNGEIYNFIDLRESLKKQGHTFRTKSDVEVIVHLYEQYGEDCPSYLDGMFALAIFDQRKNSLFLARDRMGKKPLYYARIGDQLIFASEMKSLLLFPDFPRDIDLISLSQYLSLGYVLCPRTIFTRIHQLSAGHSLSCRNGNVTIRSYWELPFNKTSRASRQELVDQGEALLNSAVRKRLVSDVPLGVFLSGGVDSSTVVALMRRSSTVSNIKTFSIRFKESGFDESSHARFVAQHFSTDHHEFTLSENNIDILPQCIRACDNPVADPASVPLYLLSREAKKFITVALSGDGGDELFAGYPTYIADKLLTYYLALPGVIQKAARTIAARLKSGDSKFSISDKLKRFLLAAGNDPRLSHIKWRMHFSQEDREALLHHDIQQKSPAYQEEQLFDGILRPLTSEHCGTRENMAIDCRSWLLDDILRKVDSMSMANAVEVRCPLLDYHLAEFTFSLPDNTLLHRFSLKYYFKDLLRSKNILPESIINRPKAGFSLPLGPWFRKLLKPMLLDTITPRATAEMGLFNHSFVQSILDEHLTGGHNHSFKLWNLLCFYIWYNTFINSHSSG